MSRDGLGSLTVEINDRTLNLIDVVKVLGEFLVSTDDAVRSLGKSDRMHGVLITLGRVRPAADSALSTLTLR